MQVEFENIALPFDWAPSSPLRPRYLYAPLDALENLEEVVVSIVTPTRGPQPVFWETVASVLNQSLQRWEWIIVDDGCPDSGLKKQLDDLAKQDPRIKVVHLPRNVGLPAAKNVGTQYARGKYVFFIDDDDLIEPTALEKMVWFLEAYPNFSITKGSTIHFGAINAYTNQSFEHSYLFTRSNPVTPRFMIRRQVLMEVGGFDESITNGIDDWEFWMRLASKGYWGHGIPEFLDWYRRRGDFHNDRWSGFSPEGIKKMRKLLKERYTELFSKGMPRVEIPMGNPYDDIPTEIPFKNRLKKEKPRWLLLIPWMGMGGADRFNLDLVQVLVSKGFEVSIVTTIGKNYTWYREFARFTPDIFILPYLLPLREYPRFLDYLIDSRNYDGVFISGSEAGHHLLPYLKAKHPHLLIVDYCHIEEDWQNGGHPRRALAYQAFIDLQLVSSHHLRQWFLDRGADPRRIHVVYTGAKVDLFASNERMRRETRDKLSISSEVPVILYAGRICEQKQPKVFANVIHNLAKIGIDFVCIVLGDGEDMPWLRRFFFRNGLRDRVRLVGAVPNSEVVKYLSASDIFFLPSKMEGISLAIYEAMSAGLAIVAANVGGQAELVTEECGVLISRSTQEEEIQKYTDVLTTLLRNPKMTKAMGEASRKRVTELFNFKKTEAQLIRELTVEAQVAHNLISSYKISEKLAIEHFRLYIETEFLYTHLHHLAPLAAAKKKLDQLHNRILSFLQRIGVYRVIQGLLWKLHKIKHLMVTALRRAKDLVWIVGHAIKVRTRNKIL